MDIIEIYIKCDLCNCQTRFGQSIYKGQRFLKYNLFVCKTCYPNRMDGLHPEQANKFKEIIKTHGSSLPKKNRNGCYILDF